MSLDVYLHVSEPVEVTPRRVIFIRRNGAKVEISREEWDRLMPGNEPVTVLVPAERESNEVYTANITHNLNRMAKEAGIYEILWRPDEIGVGSAHELIEPLTAGLALLRSDRPRFEAFNASNGWGLYEHFVPFVSNYLAACRRYPDAIVSVWR